MLTQQAIAKVEAEANYTQAMLHCTSLSNDDAHEYMQIIDDKLSIKHAQQLHTFINKFCKGN